jgi:hypothetical protein
MANFELFPKEWLATYAGHEIRVRNSWTSGIKLFVDGMCHASSSDVVALDKSRPFLRAKIAPTSGDPFVVEVFAYALLTVKIKLFVNGTQIAGDSF